MQIGIDLRPVPLSEACDKVMLGALCVSVLCIGTSKVGSCVVLVLVG